MPSAFVRSSLTLALSALVLAGCDRQEPAQPQEQANPATATIDRSHAGELMPAVTVVKDDGTELNLGATQGQPVLLSLWATWCAPCVKEMPQIDDLAGEYGDALRVVTVSQDMGGADKVARFFAKMKFANLQPWTDPETELGFKLGGGALPTTVLYDAKGQEVWRIVGEYDWSSAEVREAIAEVTG